MSVRQDVVNLIVNVGGDKAKDQLNQLRKEAANLNAEMKGIKKTSQEYTDKANELAKVTAQMDELRKTIGVTAMTQRELNQELRSLQAQKNFLTPQTKEFNELQKKINEVTARLGEVRSGIFQTTKIQEASAIASKKQSNSLFGLTQVFRELPGFTYSAQTGILGLSNNLPILADNFKSVANAVNPMTGKINGAMGALKIFGASIFSFGNIFAIAIGLFTIFSDKIFEFMGMSQKAKKGVDELTNSIGQQVGKFETLNYTINNLAIAEEDRLKAAKDMKDMYPTILENYSAEEIAAGKAASAINMVKEALIAVAMARAGQEEMDKLSGAKWTLQSDVEKKRAEYIKAQADAQSIYNQSIQQTGKSQEFWNTRVNAANQLVSKLASEIDAINKYIIMADNKMSGISKRMGVYQGIAKNAGIGPGGADEKVKQDALDEKARAKQEAKEKREEERRQKALDAKYQKELDAYDNLKNELNQLRDELDIAMMAKDKQEAARIDAKYNKLLERAKGHATEMSKIELMRQDEHLHLRVSKSREADSKMESLSMSGNQPKGTTKGKPSTLDQSWLDRLPWSKASKDKKKQENKEKLDLAIANSKEITDGLLNIQSGFANLANQREDKQLREEEKRNEAKKANFKKMLDAKRISQKQYDAEIAKLDEQMDARKKQIAIRQANRAKALAITQILIDTAMGIANIWSRHAANPITAGILTGIQGVAMGLQLAAVSGQEIPEGYREGDYTGDGDPNEVAGVVHKKEFVYTAEQTSKIGKENLRFLAKNPELASQLLYNSQNRNGARIGYQWANPQISGPTFASQNTSSSQSATSGTASTSTSNTDALLSRLIQEQQANNAILANFPSNLKAVVSLSQLHYADELYKQIQKESSIKQ